MLICPVCQTKYEVGSRKRCENDFTPLEELKAATVDDASLIEGRYKVLRQLGSGGMAIVYLVERRHIGDLAAVKIMNKVVASEPNALAQFKMEAQLAATARHPNVIQIYDFGVTKEGLPYLVMEYLEGPTLAEELKRVGTFSLERALELFSPICSAVNAAHASGLIHRDLKPSNIILEQLKGGGEFVKVLDFGIAKVMEPDLDNRSKDAVVGTLGYMSLEQIRGEAIDHRSDIYSLGVIFYELLTGQLPFQRLSSTQLLVAMAKEQPRSLKSLRPDISTKVELALLKALSKDPKERYSTAIELIQTLTDAATRAKPIFVPKQNFEEPPILPEVRVTGTYYAASTWRGVAGTLNLEVCVGREKEIERLRESFGKVAQGRGDAILITAEPGVGKSFLLHEYQKWVEAEGAVVLPARFYDYGGSQLAPYQVFLDTLRACLMGERTAPITQRIDVEILKQQFEKGKTEELVEIIQYKTGVILPGEAFSAEALAGESDKWRVFESLLEIYKRMARSAPVVFLFDDLHFADSLSLELIAYIVRNSSSTRFQVVATALAEEAKATGKVLRGWLTKQIGYSNYSEIALQGIARENAENFLTAIFGSVKVSDRDLDYLWNETQGFPFYLVELIEHLMISKKIDKSGNTWKVTGFGQFEVPPSANNLVNAKLRSFNQTSLNVLKHAAVIGEEFYFDTLADVVGMDEDELDIVVRDSVSGWVLKQQQSALGDFFRFHHGMMRRALYNSLTLSERRKIHAKVAKAIEEGQGTRKDRIAGQIAYHYYMGGIWESAVEPGIRAGELARKREAFSESVTYYCYASEAIEQQKGDVQNEGKLRIGLGEALIHLSRFEEAEKEIGKLFELASRKLDLRLRAWGEFLASRLNHSRGNFKRAVELAQLGIESVEELISCGQSDNELYRRLLQQCGYTLFMTGRLDEACEPLEKAVAVVEATGDPRPSGWALSWLGIINCYRGNGTKGLQLGEKGLKLLRASGDRMSELLAWERVGVICGMLGDKDRAIYFFENGMELARTIGYKVQESRLLVNLGEAYRLKADYKEAEVYYNQALPIARQIEQEDVEAVCLQNLGLVAIARKQFTEATTLLQQALELFRVQNRQISEAEVEWAIGSALKGLGREQEALLSYQRSLALCEKLSYADFEWRALTAIASIFKSADRLEDAQKTISRALEIVENMRKQLPEGANLKAFEEEKLPLYELVKELQQT